MRRIRDTPFEKQLHKSALGFDGIDDYVNAGNNASLNITDTITIESLIYPTASSGMDVISSRTDPPPRNNGYELFVSISTSGNKFYVNIIGAGWVSSPNVPIVLNAWNHFVGVFSGVAVIAYLNGVAYPTLQSGTITPYSGAKIGRNGDNAAFYFKGTIAEVRIYNRALSEAEVKALYLGENIMSGLVLYHNYGLGTLDDLSGNNNNGTATGALFKRQQAGYELIDPKVRK